jgi:protein-L-isoaspartate(D-aspartate) O-methyltransferase
MVQPVTAGDNEALFAFQRDRMLQEQLCERGIRDERVLAAFRALPRHRFVPADLRTASYADHPLPIGFGQTISQAFVTAFMLERLKLKGPERVLDVGTGSGFQAALLAHLVAEVHTIEIIPELANGATLLLAELGLGNIHVHTGDGSQGWPACAPYDAIAVAAAAVRVPRALLDQLAEGGRLMLPVGAPGEQRLELWWRDAGTFQHQALLSVAYVPLRMKGDGLQDQN